MASPTRLDRSSPLVHRLATALSRAERELTRRLADVLGQEGATIEEARALALLADGAGHTMGELAAYAVMTAPTLTRLVDRLVADTLAYRKVDDRDRRRVLVYATRQGRRRQRRLAQLVEAHEDDVLATAEPAAASQLVEMLRDLG
jgi:DNA-binding MarR family transcriptional regulator